MRSHVFATIGASLLTWAAACYPLPASARVPELVLQRGCDASPGIVFDPGGQYWATACDFVVLVHADTGTMVASRPVLDPDHDRNACPVAVANGGRLVAYGDGRFLQVWDPLTDEIVFSHAFTGNGVHGISISVDGRRLAAIGHGQPLVIWNVADWQPIQTLWMPLGAWEVALNPNGTQVAVTGNGGWIWNVDNGTLIHELSEAEGLVPRFSGDGLHIALSSPYHSHDAFIRAADGARVEVDFDSTAETGTLAFSPDGSWVAHATARDEHQPIEVRSLADEELVAVLTGHRDAVGGLAIHPSRDKQLRLTANVRTPMYEDGLPAGQTATWEISSGRLVRPLEAWRPIATPLLEGSPDGRWLVSASRGADVLIWDLEQGRLDQRVTVATRSRYEVSHAPLAIAGEGLLDIVFAPNSEDVLLDGASSSQLWSLTTRVLRPLEGHDARRLRHPALDELEINSDDLPGLLIDASDDGRLLVTLQADGGYDRFVSWDPHAKRELGASPWIDVLETVALSPDAKRIAVTERSRKHEFAWNTLVLDAKSGAVRRQILHTKLLAWSPDGRRLFLQGTTGNQPILVVDPRTGRTLRTLALQVPTVADGKAPQVEGASFSPDGKTLVTSTIHETVAWDLDSGARRWTRAVSGTGVTHLVGGRTLAVHESGAVMLLDAATGEPTVTLVADDTDWLLHTPDGYFMGSHGGDRLVAAVDDLVPVQLFQTARQHNRPDLVLERLGSTDVERIAHYRKRHKQTDRNDPLQVPEVRLESAVVDGRELVVEFTARDRGGNLAGYDLLVNGVPIERPGPRLVGFEQQQRARVQLEPGENWLELGVFNEHGIASYREFRQITIDDEAPSDRDLYVLAFGMSELSGIEHDRVHARKDAEDLVKLLAQAPGFRSILTRLHVDEQLTPQAVRGAAQLIEHARVEDTVIVFVVGRVPDHVNIEDLLANTPARRRLLLIDTLEHERFMHLDPRDRTGTTVLRSSLSDQLERESATFENGLFTEALLVALTSATTDRDGDGVLAVAELERAVKNSTIERANRFSRLTLPRIDVDPRRVSELPLPDNALAPIAQQVEPDPEPSPHPAPRGCVVVNENFPASSPVWMLVLVAVVRRRRRVGIRISRAEPGTGVAFQSRSLSPSRSRSRRADRAFPAARPTRDGAEARNRCRTRRPSRCSWGPQSRSC
jgi:WD40 repeat protein